MSEEIAERRPMSEGRCATILQQYEEFQNLSTSDALKHRYASVWTDIRDLLSYADLVSAQLSQALRERDELSADLLKLREATRVRPSKKAMVAVRETLEAMEAMDEEDAPALRLLVEMYDRLEAKS